MSNTERDAARYRWLRENCVSNDKPFTGNDLQSLHFCFAANGSLDDAVDQARGAFHVNNWTEHYDDNDNCYWEAPSPFADQSEDPFYFRIRQRLCDNRIEYFDASDAD